jgi:hypothetical protein
MDYALDDPRRLAELLSPAELRRAKRDLMRHYERCLELSEQYQRERELACGSLSRWPRAPVWPPFPNGYRALPCGARTRAGTPCKQIDIFPNGRCKFHGGMSTGPRTEEGRRRARANLKVGPKPMAK